MESVCVVPQPLSCKSLQAVLVWGIQVFGLLCGVFCKSGQEVVETTTLGYGPVCVHFLFSRTCCTQPWTLGCVMCACASLSILTLSQVHCR